MSKKTQKNTADNIVPAKESTTYSMGVRPPNIQQAGKKAKNLYWLFYCLAVIVAWF